MLVTDDFRAAKHLQTVAKKKLEVEEAEKLKDDMEKNSKWRHIKDQQESEDKIPTRITINGKDERSPKVLAEDFNIYFENKIE